MKPSLTIPKLSKPLRGKIQLVGSKSESNRLLIIQALARYQSNTNIKIQNLSKARDTSTLQGLLNSDKPTLDVIDAGTAMRFLTAYCSITQRNTLLTGTPRMCQRPIGILVDALNAIGANIIYINNKGYAPLEIGSFSQTKNRVRLKADVSSQFVSALLMIAPLLPQGLKISLDGDIVSKPYIQMTIDLMDFFGIETLFENNTIDIAPQNYQSGLYTITSDWSSASYWYSWVACAKGSQLVLTGLKKNAIQGDKVILELGRKIGVKSEWIGENLILTHQEEKTQETLVFDFKNCPDLAQTIAVACAIKGIKVKMYGLQSLKIKETDRIVALQKELRKLGISLTKSTDTPPYWMLERQQVFCQKQIIIDTYDDHRMAMAFAPMATQCDTIIKKPEVVNKSYPNYWEHLQNLLAKN